MPHFIEIMKTRGRVTDDEIETELTARGLDMEQFKMRKDDELPLEEQALNRQRVLWLNNEGFLQAEREKKERARQEELAEQGSQATKS